MDRGSEMGAGPAAGGLDTPPPGWGGTSDARGRTWSGLPVARRALVWAAFMGVEPEALTADTGDLARDRDALLDLLHLLEERRARLVAGGEPTEDADALLAKLRWELAALDAA